MFTSWWAYNGRAYMQGCWKPGFYGTFVAGLESSFTPTWRTFKHSLYSLTPAERVIKSRKAYIARVSPDGQVLVLAMNQKFAAHNRVMFYSLSQTAVAVIADLKGCGAKLNAASNAPIGRLGLNPRPKYGGTFYATTCYPR